MNDIIKAIEAEQLKAEVPEFSVGDTVRVYGKIKEGNRERVQVFEGVVLKKQGGSNRATFTVRKSSNGIGVEKTWPLHSPNVEKVELVRKGQPLWWLSLFILLMQRFCFLDINTVSFVTSRQDGDACKVRPFRDRM